MTARSQVRRRTALLTKPLFGLSLCAFVPLAPAYAQTLPSGGTVVTGAATINTGGSRTDIRQTSEKAIIEWKDFSIGQGGTVAIDNGKGATLNRVTGAAVSSIDGLLQATGSVYLINRNGIVVGKTGQVDVGGRFVGSTQDLSNDSFMAGGNLSLAGASEAAIVNYGKIGSLGGDVVLVAAKVENQGAIEAANGSVGLLAGYQVMLRDQAHDDGKFSVVVGGAGTSVTNAGALKAAEAELRAQNGNIYALAGTSAAIDARGVSSKDGRIFLTAGEAGEVSIASTLTAKKADGAGGAIEVTGKNILLDQGAKLVASGTSGGTVLVGGDWEGGHNADTRLLDRDIQRAEAVVVAPDAKIDVTGSAGAGGTAVLWSDNFTNFHGHIDASGATDGGRVETSSKNVLQAIGIVDAKAGSGKAGEWLLDPASVTISTATDSAFNYAGGTYTPTAGTSIINVTNLNGRLNSGTNVTITTGGAAVVGGTGDITLDSGAAISKTAGGDATLTLKADRNIVLSGTITSTVGKLNLNLNSRASDGAEGAVRISNSITTNDGNINIWGGSGAAGSGAAISSVSGYAGVLFDGLANTAVIDAGAGSITAIGRHINTEVNSANAGVRVANTTIKASGGITMTGNSAGGNGLFVEKTAGSLTYNIFGGAGAINLTGTTDSANYYGFYTYLANFNSTDGAINLKGTNTSATGTNTRGIFLAGNSTVKSSGSGSISIEGTSNGGYGVSISGNEITTKTGAISVKGTSATNIGIFMETGGISPSIRSDSGNISLVGASTDLTASKEAILIPGSSTGVTISTGGAGALSIIGTSNANQSSTAHRGASAPAATIAAGSANSTYYPKLTLEAGTGGLTISANATTSYASRTPNSIYLQTGADSVITSAGGIDIFGSNTVNLNDGSGVSISQTGDSGTVSIVGGTGLTMGTLSLKTNDATLIKTLNDGALSAGAITMGGNGNLTFNLDYSLQGTTPTVTKTGTGASKLTILTSGNANVGNITAQTGAGKLDVVVNSGRVAGMDGNVFLRNTTTLGGDITVYGGLGTGDVAAADTNQPARAATAGGINVVGHLNAGGGNIKLTGSTGGNNTSGIGIGNNISISTSGAGSVTLTGSQTSAIAPASRSVSTGVLLGTGSTIKSGSGGTTIVGSGKSGGGVVIQDYATLQPFDAANAGDLTITGTSELSSGFEIYQASSTTSASGDSTLKGKNVAISGSSTDATNARMGIWFNTMTTSGNAITVAADNNLTITASGGRVGDTSTTGLENPAAMMIGTSTYQPKVNFSAGTGNINVSATARSASANSISDQANGSTTYTSTSGDVVITGNNRLSLYRAAITAGRNVNLSSATSDVATVGAINVGNALTVSAFGKFDSNNITQTGATGAFTVNAGDMIAVGNVDIKTNDAITINAGGALTTTGTTLNTGTIMLRGNGDASLVSGRNLNTGTITALGNGKISADAGTTLTTGAITTSGSGDISLSAVSALTPATILKKAAAGTASNLLIKSQSNVTIGNTITAEVGAGAFNVTIQARSADAAAGTITVGNAITTRGGNIVLRGGSAALSPLVDPTVDLAAYTSAMLATGAVIDFSSGSAAFNAGGGDIEMRSLGSNTSYGLNLTNKSLGTTGSGSLRLYALGRTTDQFGVQTNSLTSLSSASGDIVLMGASRYAGADGGVYLNNGSVTSTGGAITIAGVGNGLSSAGSSYGVILNSNATVRVDGSKALTVNGRGGAAAANAVGVSINGGASVRSTAAGAINVTGLGGGAAGSTALTHSGIAFDGANNFAVVNATGSGAVTLTGRAGNANSYGIYQGNAGASTLGTATYTGNLTLVANSMFLNAKNGATPVAAKLLTSGLLTLRPEDGGNLTLGSDIYAGFINNNVLTGNYSGIVFGGATGTGTGLTLYTQNGANTYAIPVTLAGTGTVSITGDMDNKALVANGGLALAGTGVFTQSVDINTTQLTGSAGTVSFNNSGNTIGKLGPMSLTNKLDLFTSSALEIIGAVTTGSGIIRSIGDLTMSAGSSISASGPNTALQLATNGKFFNNSGAGALAAPNGRWLLWLQDPLNDVGGLSYSFKQYGASYGITAPAQTTGNGVMYNQMPLLTISLKDNVTKVYDGTTDAALTQNNFVVTGLLGNDKATVYALGSFNNKNVGTAKTVTADEMAVVVRDGAIRIYGYGLANYTASAVMGSITARALTASLTGNLTRTYDGSATALLTGSNFLLANAVATDNIQLVGPTTGTYNNKNVGSGKTVTVSGFALSGADAGNYTVNSSATANWGAITPKALGASLTGSVTKIYDGNVLATGLTSSNVAMTGIVSGDNVALGSGLVGTYANKNAGIGKSVTAFGLSLTGTDAANYTIASSVTGAIGQITRKDISASLTTPVTKVYDGTTTATLQPGNLAGIITGDLVTVSSGTAAYDTKNAGTNKLVTISGISLSGADAGNYNLLSSSVSANVGTITARSVAVGVTGRASKTYDGSTALSGAQIAGLGYTLASGDSTTQGLLANDGVALNTSGITAALVDRNAGTGKALTVSGYSLTNNALGNYVLSSSSASGLADVARATLTMTAVSDTKIYNGTTASSGSVQFSGLVGTDSASATQAFDSRNAGERLLKVQDGYTVSDGNGGANYFVNRVDAAGLITQRAVSTTVHVANKVYDGTTVATGTFDPVTGIITGDAVEADASLSFADKHVGTGKVVTVSNAVLKGADAGNYKLDPIGNGTANITAATLMLTAVSDTKTYDRTLTSDGAVQAVGLMAGDSFTASQLFDSRDAGARTLQVTDGWAIEDGNSGNNYVVSLGATANGTILQKQLTATASVSNKVYDGNTSATGVLSKLNGIITDDQVELDGTNGSLSFYDRNAGDNKAVTATGYFLTGADAHNYSLNAIANSNATISRASVVLQAVTDTRQYDGTTASSGAVQAIGLIAGDGFSANQAFSGRDAGSHTIQVAGYTVFDGNNGNNYDVSFGSLVDGTITRRVVQAKATVNNKVYDGTLAATGVFSGLSNVVGSDDVVLDDTGAILAFYDRDAGNGKTVTVAGVGLTGADAGNYMLSDIANGTANITKATLTLTAVTDSKIYDGTTTSLGTVQYSGLIAGDSVSATQAFDVKNAGTRTLQVNDWVVEDGNGGGNYAVVLSSAAAGNIEQKLLTGALTGTVSKVYDRTTTATLQPLNIAGVVAGDDLVVTTASGDFADVNVGVGKTVTVSGMQLTGTDAGNYVLSATSASADIGTITARQVAVTVTGRGSKTYDGNTALSASQYGTLTFALAGGDSATQAMLGADGVGLDGSTLSATFDDRNAGIGKALTLTGFSLLHNDLGNYALTTEGATGLADILRATLTLDAVSDSKIYDGTKGSTGVVQWSGLIAGDSVTATQVFDSKNAGARTLVVDSWTIEDGNGGANYNLVRNTASGSIDRKQLSAALTGTVTKTYDGTTAATLLPTNIAGIIATDDVVVNSLAAEYADKNAGTSKLVTVSGISLSGADAANYDLTGSSASAYIGTIEARKIVLTSTGQGRKTYDGTDYLSSNQLGTLIFALAEGDTATRELLADDGISLDTNLVWGTLADRNAGTGKGVTLGGFSLVNNDLGNYVLASPTLIATALVDRAALTLTAVSDSKIYNGNTDSIGIVDVTGLVAGDTVTASQAFDSRNAGARLLKVQTDFVLEDGNGGANYVVTRVDANGTIERRATSTSVSVANKVYDGTTSAVGTFGELDNLVTGDHVAANGTLSFADRNAGLGKVVTVSNATLTGADAGNYILDPVADGVADILKATLTLTASADTKVYDGTTASSGLVLATGLVSTDSVNATQAFDTRNAGVRALQVQSGWVVNDGNGGNNYAVTIGSATAGTITPKVLTATATVQNKVYDGTTAANGTFADLAGIIGSDNVVLNSANGSLAFVDRNAGFGKAVIASGYALDGTDAANYTLDPIAQGTADIFKASLVLNAVEASKVYDGGLLSDGKVNAVGLIAGDTVVATQAYDQKNVGVRTLTVQDGWRVYDGNGGGNYDVTVGSSASGTITPKSLAAGATVTDKVYDGTTAASGIIGGLAGVVGSDLVALDPTNARLSFIDRNAGNGKTVIVSGLTLTGDDAGNYTLSEIANGTANILKAALTMTASTDGKIYDGTVNSTGTVTISGLVDIDTATATQAFDTKNAGSRTLKVSDWKINDGNNGNNYEVTFVDAAGNIEQKLLSGTLTGTVTKVYDGNDIALPQPINLDGVIAGDVLSLSTTGSYYDTRNVGTGMLVTVTGMTLNGADAGNYVLLQDSASAMIGTITPRAVTVVVGGLGSKTYDGTTLLGANHLGTIGFTLADGDTLTQDLLAADGITLDTSGVTGLLADRNAGTGKAVTLSGYALAKNDLGNYELATSSVNGVADIARASLKLSAVSDEKTYDGTNASSGSVLAVGLVDGDRFEATQAFDGRNAGSHTLQVSNWKVEDGYDGMNYVVTFADPASGLITQRHLTTTAHADDKVYDGTATANVRFAGLNNLVGDDRVTVTGSFAFSDKNAGQNKTVNVIGIALQGTDAANYVLDPIGELAATISPKALTARFAGPVVKGYDGADLAHLMAGDIVLDGVMANDQVNASATGRYADRNAGVGKIVTVADLMLNGADAGNYLVDHSLTGAVGTITPRQISVTFANLSKVRGTPDPVFTYTIGEEGLVAGDTMTGSPSRAAGEAVGSYAIGLGSLSAGGNYTLTVIPASLEITARSAGGDDTNGGRGPVTPVVIGEAKDAADQASQGTAPNNTSGSTAPTQGGIGFNPGAQFGWGGTGQLPGGIPVSVQIGNEDPFANAGQNDAETPQLGRGASAGGDEATSAEQDGEVNSSTGDELLCQGGTDLRDCKTTVRGSGLPYPSNRVISPNLRFIQR